MTSSIDVLIIGAGPTGGALAIDLGRRGHTVRLVDASPGAFDGSRAKGIQPRSLEVLEDLGALEGVLTHGSTYPLMGIHLGPATVPWRMFKNRPPRPGVPYPNTWLISQQSTNAALHVRARRLGILPEFSTTLTALAQDEEGVTATLALDDDGEEPRTETVTARYLVGADGGSSTVRRSIGIPFQGSTDEADRVILFDAVTSGLSRNRWHVWPGLGKTFVSACPLPSSDLFQWMIRIRADEDAPDLSRAALTARLADRIGAKTARIGEIAWTSVFRPNVRLARSYRSSRVFLAGDAAHVHTPAGAQGLNTGLQDSYNLGWKLSQVLHGAPESLLDTYEAERQPIAAAVLGLSTEKYDGLGTLDLKSITRGDAEQQLGLHYHGGPLAPVDAPATSALRVGDRAPDARVSAQTGGDRRIFDTFAGPHFTLLAAGTGAADDAIRLAWPDTGAALVRVIVAADDAAAANLGVGVSGGARADHVLIDRGGEFADMYGISGDTLILVRPDGYIGAVAQSDRVDSIRKAARAYLPE